MTVVLLAVVALAYSCNRKSGGVITDNDGPDRTNYKVEKTILDTMAFISRGHCYGRCPVYEAMIFNNGIVIYKGIENVDKNGLHHAKLSQTQLDALIDSIIAVDYLTIPDTFPSGKVRIADLPTTYTMVQLNDERHVIVNRNFESDNSAATYARWRSLLRFEDHLDGLLNSVSYQPIEQLKTD